MRLAGEPVGLYVVNASPASYSGWATLQAAAIRDGTRIPKVGSDARFWVENLAPNSIRRMKKEDLESQVRALLAKAGGGDRRRRLARFGRMARDVAGQAGFLVRRGAGRFRCGLR